MSEGRLVITGMSAADFYRRRFPAFVAPDSAGFQLDGPCVYRNEDVWAKAPFWLDRAFMAPEGGVVHVLTQSAAERSNARKVHAHVWSGDFPEGAFLEYNADVAIATPAFTFLQLATELKLAELVAYGDEICGYYSLSVKDPLGYRTRKVPLITVEKLREFVESAAGMRGCRQALKALPHIVDGTRTPDQCIVRLLACMSYHRGGYCLPNPQLNYQVELSRRAKLLLGRDKAVVDMYWPDSDVSLDIREPIGAVDKMDHIASHDLMGSMSGKHAETSGLAAAEGAQSLAIEAQMLDMRNKALGFSGVKAAEIMREQVYDFYAFEDQVLAIARLLGKHIPGKKRGPLPARVLLREILFSWIESHGHSQ